MQRILFRKFTSMSEEDHRSVFEPIDSLIKLTAKLCTAVCLILIVFIVLRI